MPHIHGHGVISKIWHMDIHKLEKKELMYFFLKINFDIIIDKSTFLIKIVFCNN